MIGNQCPQVGKSTRPDLSRGGPTVIEWTGLNLRSGEEGATSLVWAGIRGTGRATSLNGRIIVLSWRRVSRNHTLENVNMRM